MRKKVILIVGVLFIVVVAGVSFFLQSSKQLFIPQSAPIPTPVPASGGSVSTNGITMTFAIIEGQATITFSSSISAGLQADTLVTTNPSFDFTHAWTDSKTLTLQPIGKIDENTTYVVKLTAPFATASWNVLGSDLLRTTIQQNMQQAAADQAFSQRDQQITNSYPWITSLPLFTNDYFVYFDTDQKQFVAKLYPKSPSSVSVDTQVATLKQEVLSQLSSLGIDTNQYTVSWTVVSNGGQ